MTTVMRKDDEIRHLYDELYASRPTGVFGRNKQAPDPLVVSAARLLPRGARILDLGAGQGRNALWLARQGFSVEARDISPIGLAQLREAAAREGLAIDVVEADARAPLTGSYDAIFALFFFHHIERDEGLSIIKVLKAHTAPSGLNGVAAFTEDGDFFRDDPQTHHWFLKKDELHKLYRDWEVMEYRERRAAPHERRKDGKKMSNISARLIASRPRYTSAT